MATERTASVTWRGDLMSGEGTVDSVGSGAFGPLDVTWASRAEDPNGLTSPEELIAAALDNLIDELERSYRDTQERLSDPTVYNDHREAADVGRRLKELEGPYKLAVEWRETQDDLAAARADTDLRELVPELEGRLAQIEEELKLALVPTDPADSKDVILEIRQGVGGDEAAIWAGDIVRMLTRYAERRGFKWE